jgi:hypothetical protein
MMKYLLTIVCIALLTCCTISGEVPSTEYFLFKEWRLDKVTVNGIESSEDVSSYRVALQDDFTFVETGVDGQAYEGTWALKNNGKLIEMEGTYWSIELECAIVEFLIVDIQLRELEVRPLKGCDKLGSGNLDIIYFLVPVKQ